MNVVRLPVWIGNLLVLARLYFGYEYATPYGYYSWRDLQLACSFVLHFDQAKHCCGGGWHWRDGYTDVTLMCFASWTVEDRGVGTWAVLTGCVGTCTKDWGLTHVDGSLGLLSRGALVEVKDSSGWACLISKEE